MKRLFLMLMLAIAFSVNADAQGWLNRLKDKAVDAAKNAVERTSTRPRTMIRPLMPRARRVTSFAVV